MTKIMELATTSDIEEADVFIIDGDEGTRIITLGDLRESMLNFSSGMTSIDEIDEDMWFIVADSDGTWTITWDNLRDVIFTAQGLEPISTSDVDACWT